MKSSVQIEPTLAQLNLLQLSGIISDNCVTWADVAEVDKARAIQWLVMQSG